MKPDSLLIALAVVALVGCASTAATRFDAAPLWNDPDRHPFKDRPNENPPTLVWDGADHSVFRPISRFFAVDPGGEAANVNSWDEVPDSSWFTNRIGRFPMSSEEMAAGPCTTPPLDTSAPITVVSGKSDGATPGFVVKGLNGQRYLLKVDDVDQAPRPTAADAIGARIYYATGFTVPCNRVVFVDRARLSIAAGATIKTWTGGKAPFTTADLDMMLTHATRLRDGRYRLLASQWLDGKPIGPWRYEGTRGDDPNDVIPHEDRRELRGSRLLAAWLGHTDARAQNTLDTWIDAGHGYGWVRHDLVDFSDCFGSIWEPVELGRRIGHAYWLDIGAMAADFVTLGVIERPWDTARFGRSGKVFGYYAVDDFDPSSWVMEYPNSAFSRMTERDGAWMARIIAHFTDERLRRIIRTGQLDSRFLEDELFRILRGRRDAILRRYLSRLSPLAQPEVRADPGGSALCAHDLAVLSGIAAGSRYAATLREGGGPPRQLPVQARGAEVCVKLPRASPEADSAAAGDAVVEMSVVARERTPVGLLRVHLRKSRSKVRVVGLERVPSGAASAS